MECLIQDYGTSELRGGWVEVVYNDDKEMRISQNEMQEMLANRVSGLSRLLKIYHARDLCHP